MASQIISNTIDENFPVAGQDNDSQGFRDNFNIIKTALSVAQDEITDLQDGVVRLDREENDFDNNKISNAVFVGNTLETIDTYKSSLPVDLNASFLQGYVYPIKVTVPSVPGNVDINLLDLPVDKYASMRFILTGNNESRTVTFKRAIPGETILTDGSPVFTGSSITVNSDSEFIVIDVFSYDGTNIFLKHVGTFS